MRYRIISAFLIFSLTSYALAQGQDYTVTAKSQRINDTKYEGFVIPVSGPIDLVTDQMYVYLKAKSKIRRKRNYYSISEIKMDELALDSTILYLKLSDKGSICNVWMGIKTFGLEKERTNAIESAIQNELVLMARSYYVHQQELKILEAETAAQVVSKTQQTLIDEKVKLATSLEEKEARKIELEELLKTNTLDIDVLKQKLIDNKLAQDSIYIDLQKVKKVIEIQKQKLKEID